MDLHELEFFAFELHERLMHLPHSRLAARDPNFGGDKKLFVNREFTSHGSSHRFSIAIHRRRVDEPTAGVIKCAEDILNRRHLSRSRRNIEGRVSTQSNTKQLFSA